MSEVNEIQTETIQPTEVQAEAKKAKKERIRRPSLLNKFFHHIDRGSTTGREISDGLLMCILSVCGIFMNMQLFSRFFIDPAAMDSAAMGEVYASYYFFAMIAAFVGSLLMGLVARLPLVQVSGLGMTTVLISTLGIGSGLSYANLLAINFLSSAVYTVLMAVPVVRRGILNAIPSSVRKALPAAMGLLIAFVAMQLTGLVSFGSSPLAVQGTGTVLNAAKIAKNDPAVQIANTVQLGHVFDFKAYAAAAYKGDSYYPMVQMGLIGVVVSFISYALLRKTKHPVLYALLIGTGAYFIGYLTRVVFYVTKKGAIQFELDSLWARLWMVGSEDAQHLHLSTIFRDFSFGKLLKEGFAFSAAGENAVLLTVTGALMNLMILLTGADGAIQSAEGIEEKEEGMALLCNSVMNLAAPALGQPAANVGLSSVAARRDGAKSGLAAVVASLGFLVSAFAWIVPFLFATTTNYEIQFNMYGHYGKVLYLLTDASFMVVDAVMAIVGLIMAASAMKDATADGKIVIPFAATVLITLVTSNLALGVSCGLIAHLLVSIFDRERSLTIGNVLAAVVGIAVIVLSILL